MFQWIRTILMHFSALISSQHSVGVCNRIYLFSVIFFRIHINFFYIFSFKRKIPLTAAQTIKIVSIFLARIHQDHKFADNFPPIVYHKDHRIIMTLNVNKYMTWKECFNHLLMIYIGFLPLNIHRLFFTPKAQDLVKPRCMLVTQS